MWIYPYFELLLMKNHHHYLDQEPLCLRGLTFEGGILVVSPCLNENAAFLDGFFTSSTCVSFDSQSKFFPNFLPQLCEFFCFNFCPCGVHIQQCLPLVFGTLCHHLMITNSVYVS